MFGQQDYNVLFMKEYAMHYLYQITNKVTGQSYIGETSNIQNRFNMYKGLLRMPHWSKFHYIHNEIEKYGEDAFQFKVIVKGTKEYIKDLEGKAIIAMNTLHPSGYNREARIGDKRILCNEALVNITFNNQKPKKFSNEVLAKRAIKRQENEEKEVVRLTKEIAKLRRTLERLQNRSYLTTEEISERRRNQWNKRTKEQRTEAAIRSNKTRLLTTTHEEMSEWSKRGHQTVKQRMTSDPEYAARIMESRRKGQEKRKQTMRNNTQ